MIVTSSVRKKITFLSKKDSIHEIANHTVGAEYRNINGHDVIITLLSLSGQCFNNSVSIVSEIAIAQRPLLNKDKKADETIEEAVLGFRETFAGLRSLQTFNALN